MHKMSNKKFVRCSALQKEVLLQYMLENNQFALNNYTGPLGAERMAAEWEKLRAMLSNHGPDRSVEQWKITWRDMKKSARKENAERNSSLNQTGNAVPVTKVSDVSHKVLTIIGTASSSGDGPPETVISSVQYPPAAAAAAAAAFSTAVSSEASIHNCPSPLAEVEVNTESARGRGRLDSNDFIGLQREHNEILKENNCLLREQLKRKDMELDLLRQQNFILKRMKRKS